MEHESAKPGCILDPRILHQLPDELIEILCQYPVSQQLDALARAALQPSYTNRLFPFLEPVFVDIAGRWLLLDLNTHYEQILSGFSRILPFCPYLRPFAATVLRSENARLPLISQTNSVNILDLNDDTLASLLLSVFRFLSFDVGFFSSAVCPNQLQSLFSHPSEIIRYLAVRCFCLYIHAADAAMEGMVKAHCPSDILLGGWEGQEIDYKFLSLWEERRWQLLETELQHARKICNPEIFDSWIKSHRNDTYTANMGGVIIPTPKRDNVLSQSSLVQTSTVQENLHRLGASLLLPQPLLLVGQPGVGKTSLVMDVAREMGHASSMITLHLNEQTDSKSLLGVYSASAQNGSFRWQPGVLTQAAKEGRWILIEDLDRAPAEVISVLLPLVENRELVLPGRQEHIRCAEGFRVIATVRSTVNARGEEVAPTTTMLGNRLWSKIKIAPLQPEDVRQIINHEFPLLQPTRYTAAFLSLFNRINAKFAGSTKMRGMQSRQIGLRDLMKFCQRVDIRLRKLGVKSGQEAIPEGTLDDIFMDAVDCFASYLSDDNLRWTLISTIAEELQISPQRMKFCLSERVPPYSDETAGVTVGREFCPKTKTIRRSPPTNSSFANTKSSLRTMEQVAAAVNLAEPVLLVGETGIGKTTVVQQLAALLNRRLTVVNLSQQSEATDLLGGFKPVNIRSTALPLIEEFNSLFESTFSVKKNQKFLSSVSKSAAASNWPRLVTILKEAIKMASTLFNQPSKSKPNNDGESESGQATKRRKLDTSKYSALAPRWQSFAAELEELEARVAQGDAKFSFAFVPGKIVKALRNGEWVLLDEINLASPDTLETIASLLHHGRDGLPSVLLSEAGEVERIVGHPDFRIFGAMNPATDAGKRDLVPGLRSRFTEIYVQSPDNDPDDLLSLIKTYLGPLVHRDQLAAPSLSNLYLDIKKLNAQNKLTDGAGQKPHFSIRTLVRAMMYVTDHAHIYGVRRAIYEGFCMSFLTLLSKESERSVIPFLEKHIFGKLGNSRSALTKTPREPDDGAAYVQFKHYWMRKGEFHLEDQPHYIITPFIERNLMNLVRASSTRRFPILLQGPTSSGKTSMVEYLAKISGNKFVRINNHEHTDLQEYLGSYVAGEDGTLKYQEGILVEALRKGYWIVLDELNLAPTDVLEAMNRLLDDNRELFVPETQEVIRPHTNFMLFATQNPAGLYGGRKVLSRAFRNRFLELHFDDIPEDELEVILKERSQIAPSFCTRIVNVYRQLSVLRQSNRLFEQRNSFATLRDLFRWATRRADDREQLATQGFMLLAERVRNAQERQAVKKVIEKVMGVRLDERAIYSNASLEARLARLSVPAPKGIVWTQAMRRLFILVSEAIDHNEPVLLVGETGCGKTQLCQAVTEAYGKELFMVNAHVNLETGDLIGAQRPVRNRAAIAQHLRSDLIAVLSSIKLDSHIDDSPLDDLKKIFHTLQASQLEHCDRPLLEKIQQNSARVNALFEWSDGSLVTAMKTGQHFLLDELSLADDSVLERLNSVLEPSRTLLLAEKGPSDSLVVGTPGFQFLGTMNPGGDYGKRELSAALRNRLTEIWVPELSDDEDILPILEKKVRSPLPNTPKGMVEFAKWFKSSLQGSSSTSISIRDLLAWASFINSCKELKPVSAIVHGACLVYVDALGANPSALLANTSKSLEEDRISCLKRLGELFNVDATSIYRGAINLDINGDTFKIGEFSLPIGPASSTDSAFALDAPTTLSNTLRIARGLQSSKPILLEGSPGVGKTTLVAALAQVLGVPLTRINLSEQTDLTDLFGSDVPVEGGGMGDFAWSDAPFLRTMQQGGWVLLDEMNLASQSVLEGLNSCLDHRQQVYIAELDQTFRRHPDFFLFATQNPHHQGGGRKGLPASFVNRFTVVYADSFTCHDLQLICNKLSPNTPRSRVNQLVDFITSLNDKLVTDRRFALAGAPWEVNLRDLSRWFKLLDSKPNLSPSQFLDVVISHRFRTPQDRAIVTQLYTDIFGTAPDTRSYFHNLSCFAYQIGFGTLDRDQLINLSSTTTSGTAPRNLPINESITLCVENRWPCLLVGASGSGKTTTIRHLAALQGAKLVELSLNADTDTMDLIGGFEQRDNQRQFSAFANELRGVLRKYIVQEYARTNRSSAADAMVSLYHLAKERPFLAEDASKRLLELSQSHPGKEFQNLYERSKSLCGMSQDDSDIGFEWTEGLLIHAIRQGHWVVLDNANLCNASVLDRLNSLMEPHGCLIINEQKTADGSAKVIQPHPNFRLFLTVDPRHGELSRAMRNRAVEIFFAMDEFPVISPSSEITYTGESSVYRIRECQKLIQQHFSADNGNHCVQIAIDHLSPKDLIRIQNSFESFTRLWATFSGVPVHSADSILSRYGSLLRDGALIGWPTDCNSISSNKFLSTEQFIEPLHPLVNEPRYLVSASDERSHIQLMHLGKLQELQVQSLYFNQELKRVGGAAANKKSSDMNRLERSLTSKSIPSHMKDPTQPLADFLFSCGEAISIYLRNLDIPSLEKEIPQIIIQVSNYCWDVLHLSQRKTLDNALFSTYLEIGRAISTNFQHIPSDLLRHFSAMLGTFNANWKLTSGHSMQRIWDRWRPAVPTNSLHANRLIEFQQLCLKVDQMPLKSGVPFAELGQLYNSLIQVQKSMLLGADSTLLLPELRKAVEQLEAQSRNVELWGTPYFATELEGLCQYRDFEVGDNTQSGLTGATSLVAGRPSRPNELSAAGSIIPELLSRLSRFAGFHNPQHEQVALFDSLCMRLLGKATDISQVPLGQMELLRLETKLLMEGLTSTSKQIADDQLLILRSNIAKIFGELLTCHEDLMESESLKTVLQLLQNSGSCGGNESAQAWNDQIRLRDAPNDSESFREFVNENLPRCLELLQLPKGMTNGYAQMGELCIRLAVALLKCFIPSRPFDPSLSLAVDYQRYMGRRREANERLDVLRACEQSFTGQSTSLRIEAARDELECLGNEPPQPPVTRPVPSKIDNVQTQFSSILNSILNQTFDQLMSAAQTPAAYGAHDRGTTGPSRTLLQQNIQQVCKRLSEYCQGYDDITILSVRFLELLDLGISLTRHGHSQPGDGDDIVRYISQYTPFLNGGSSERAEASTDRALVTGTMALEADIHHLHVLGAAHNINPGTFNDTERQTILRDVFHKVYESWKSQLEVDKSQHAEDSRFYRYRGSFEDDQEADTEEINHLFPTYEKDDEELPEAPASSPSRPNNLASKINSAFQGLFNSEDKESRLKQVIKDSARFIGSISSRSGDGIISPGAEQYLPAALLVLEDLNAVTPSKSYSFYTDPNAVEVEKLATLVERTKARFSQLRESWPEHATLSDVIDCCSEIFKFEHREPLAKFLTKSEKLHSFIYEWQSVASREYSASDCYDDLTSLLISWRRLELSTWSRLLDIEDEKCQEEAAGWWFVAYEVMVDVPLRLLHDGQDLSEHTKELVATLEKFICSTPIGQLRPRLQLIERFTMLLGYYTLEFPGLSQLSAAILNLHHHYSPYLDSAEKLIKEGRKSLEGEIKEQIKLASWKDTNIVALRESARRSHHKLFKYVKKYRALLSQPCEELLSRALPDPISDQEQGIKGHLTTPSTAPTAAVDVINAAGLWDHRPARFRNPDSTVKNMGSIYGSSFSEFDASAQLKAVMSDVVESIADFKSRTPKTLTEDNKEEVQHLKAQKHRFYADKLKELRQMGFRSNLGTDILQKQESISAVLASTSHFPDCVSSPQAESADGYFHRFLHLVPPTRQAARNYSEDLSNVEAARSAGFLEGLLYHITRQREVISPIYNALGSLGAIVKLLSDTHRLGDGGLRTGDIDMIQKSSKAAFYWLPTVLGLCVTILDIQSKHAAFDSSDITASLLEWKNCANGIQNELEQLVRLPQNVSSETHERVFSQANAFVSRLRTEVLNYIQTRPETSFALKQLLPWIEYNSTTDLTSDNGHGTLSVNEFDASLIAAMDKILVAIQRVNSAVSGLPSSIDNPAWLTKTDQIVAKSLAELHIEEISTAVEDILSKIPSISDQQGFGVIVASIGMALPIIQQYQSICIDLVNRYTILHREVCKLGYTLAKSFKQIASEGFCSPSEASKEQGSSDKLEGGTGLGEGEGAEDISKDIQDDEDLSDLAQQKQEEKEDTENGERAEDAVNMDNEELNADTEEQSRENEEKEDGDSEAEGEDELDEETGSVDGLDSSAVDEKLWDGENDESQKDTENDEGKGETNSEETPAAAEQQKSKAEPDEKPGGEDEEESPEAPEDEQEAVGREEMDVSDPQAQENEVLDLPEDIALDGEQKDEKESDIEDGMSDISMDDHAQAEDAVDETVQEDEKPAEDTPMSDVDMDGMEDDVDEENPPNEVGEEAENDNLDEQKQDEDDLMERQGDDGAADVDNTVPSEAVSGVDQNEKEAEGTSEDALAKQPDGQENEDNHGSDAADQGKDGKQANSNESGGKDDDNTSKPQLQSFKKLGDILEEWHKSQREINEPSEETRQDQDQEQNINMEDADFEHVANDEDAADTQALGQADEEQSQAINQSKAIDSEAGPQDNEVLPDIDENEDEAVKNNLEDLMQVDQDSATIDQAPLTSLTNGSKQAESSTEDHGGHTKEVEDIEDVDAHLSSIHLNSDSAELTSPDEARRLWAHYESLTHDLSLSLTEQLRLILAPTMATKLRGDFRTGKRLNIKRIIPYIASQYKRDKIWMRRSIPSKRNYQIMLAVDDSKSMLESASGQLAFQTLALVSRSLSMLEAGDLCIVGFGNEDHIRVAHSFGKPFSSEAGMQVFQHFGYKQTGTNVRQLIADSIALFREARAKRTSTSSTGDLWQLQLIISDGICEDHESISRLVRQAHEERIMIVFIIVDAVQEESRSIMNLSQATFESDGAGEGRWKMKKYLDGFPFPYYLVVRNVQELPTVLSMALKQWFAEVVEVSS